ncbi:hypothetical protein [Mucilaginibacter xinganensis]|uniref:Uncharacterized protein n=1 Tax=Mucilaginibacter xinganensis TaxID=1234841 RepID=A0A223NUS7_9SPHI|nr:hypothetical protein [Mucilaginibacter xinganensis]ASU33424.1 hypothetical protein MuYL_1526 [Mucilaginibacter xinganensis]
MIKKKTVEDHLFNKPLWIVDLFKKTETKISKLEKSKKKLLILT